jgi:hypothetical protein
VYDDPRGEVWCTLIHFQGPPGKPAVCWEEHGGY